MGRGDAAQLGRAARLLRRAELTPQPLQICGKCPLHAHEAGLPCAPQPAVACRLALLQARTLAWWRVACETHLLGADAIVVRRRVEVDFAHEHVDEEVAGVETLAEVLVRQHPLPLEP